MAETLKDIIDQLKIQNTSSKLPVIGEIKNLGSQFGKLNLSFKRFSDSTVQLNSEMMEKNDLINAENLSNQNDNAELLNLQLMDIGNVFSTKIDDLKGLLLDGPRVNDEMLNEIKNQSNYMQEVGMMQGDYFSELKEQLITNNEPTREEVQDNQSDDSVAKETLVVSKDSNSLLTQMMSFFMSEAERDKLREQEAKNERKSGKPLSEKTYDPSRLIRGNKGILGVLQSFLTTAFLGPKGKALLQTLIPGRFTLGGFGKTLLTGIAGVIFGPELLHLISTAIKDGMKADGIVNGALEGAKSFLKNADATTLGVVGGVAGLFTGGIPGAIAGALLGMSVKGIGDAMGGDATAIDLVTGNVTKLQGLIGGAATGAGMGLLYGSKFGLKGALAGAVLGAGIGGIAGALNSNEPMDFTSTVLSLLGTAGGVFAALKLGAIIGAGGGPLGLIAGALIGAALGLAFDSILKAKSKGQQALDKQAESATTMSKAGVQLSSGEINQEEYDEILAKESSNFVSTAEDVGDALKNTPIEYANKTAGAMARKQLEEAGVDGEALEATLGDFNDALMKKSISEFNELMGTNFENVSEIKEKYYKDSLGGWEILGEKFFDKKGFFLNEDKKFYIKDEEVRNKRSLQTMGKGNPDLYEAEKNTPIEAVLMNSLGVTEGRRLFRDIFKSPEMNTLRGLALGDLFTPEMGPITAVINEDARFSPEGVFNKPQMQYIADLIKPKETVVKFKSENDYVKNPQIQERYVAMNSMQTENDVRRREMATPIVMPPSAPNIVDNKNITVQEQFNVTELLPSPSSHISFKDNILY